MHGWAHWISEAEPAEKRDGAWKAVVPFAVAGRYAAGLRQADAADKRLVELNQRAVIEGCELATWIVKTGG